MNGEFVRGEVYWLRMDNGIGGEEAAKRPVVIISNDKGNENAPTVICAYLTSKPKYGRIFPRVYVGGKYAHVMCMQLITIDKTRLLQYIGSLNDDEMELVDRGLLVTLSLNIENDQIEENDEQIEEDVTRLEEAEHRARMWQKLYEKVLDELVSVRMSIDIENKMEKPVVVVKPEPVPEPEVVEEESRPKVEINTCSSTDLLFCGCSSTQIRSLIEHRPYNSLDELRSIYGFKRVDFNLLKDRLYCIPQGSKTETVRCKVNLNTDTVDKICKCTGICNTTARQIKSYIKNHGPFESVGDIVNVPRCGERFLKKYGDLLEV